MTSIDLMIYLDSERELFLVQEILGATSLSCSGYIRSVYLFNE
jgi:hypothetical protein